MARDGEARPDICVIGTDPAGIEIAFGAAALGVPVVLVTGRSQETGDPAALRRLRALGVRVIEAEPEFLDRRRLKTGEVTIRARRFVLALPEVPPPLPFSGDGEMREPGLAAPAGKSAHLLVIGGGPKGIERALDARRAGTRVTLLSDGAILPGFDREAADILRAGLERAGVALREDVTLEGGVIAREEGGRDQNVLTLEGGSGPLVFTHLVNASEGFVLPASLKGEKAGLRFKEGRLEIGSGLATSNRAIHAVGAAGGQPGFAHHRAAEVSAVLGAILFRRAAKHYPVLQTRIALADSNSGLPALAELGITESALAPRERAQHRFYRVALAETEAARASEGVTRPVGHIKAITTASGQIRGVSILAADAPALIVPFQLAIAKGMRLADLAEIPIPAPGHAEAIGALARLALRDRLTAPSTKRMMRLLRLFG
jgi:pyruvate/2-oxoglutarate dehydrogenase complex dihydrolipoamide dehydrogenase (E3) component